MVRLRRSTLAFATVAMLSMPSPAYAGDDGAVAFGVLAALSTIGVDVMFTAYSGDKARTGVEPEREWMIAQAVVVGGQAVAANALSGIAGSTAPREEGLTLVFLPLTTWTSTLTTFSTWSLSHSPTRVADRLGVSGLVGANLAFTSTAVGAAFARGSVPTYIAIPEIALMAPESAFAIYAAAKHPEVRAEWVAMAAWSGVLTVHGIVSLVDRQSSEWDTPPFDGQPPAEESVDPTKAPMPLVVPAPVAIGDTIAPGLVIAGAF